jgi:hypothetical protein
MGRCPSDFMFQIAAEKWNSLKSQTVISNARATASKRGKRAKQIDGVVPHLRGITD